MSVSDTLPTANPYQQAWAERRFVLARCARCGRFNFPAYPVCPHCGGPEIVWDTVSGHGALYTWAVVPERPDAGERVLVLVDLDEQVRVPGTLVDCAPDCIVPGMELELVWLELTDPPCTVPAFHRPSRKDRTI